MKYLVVLVIAFAAFVAADEEWKPAMEKETFEKIHENCLKESGLTKEQLDKVTDLKNLDDKKGHEYVHCFATKLGVFTDDKGYNLDRVLTQASAMAVNDVNLREIATSCMDNNEQKSTPAEWAFRGIKCAVETGGNVKNKAAE